MLATSPHLQRVTARMREFFAVHAPWQRRLWTPGAALTLWELLEATDAVRDRVLGQHSIDWFADTVRRRIPTDPGLGGVEQRRALESVLGKGLVAGSERAERLRWLAEDITENYLSRWHAALAAAPHDHQAERVARLVASHLLDRGYSQDFLHRWLTYLCAHDPTEHDAASLVAQADALTRKRRNRYRVLVLFETAYPAEVTTPEAWLPPQRARDWLATKRLLPLVDADFRGALLLRLRGPDPEAAVAQAGDIVDALISRVAVGTRHTLVAQRHAFVAGEESRRFQLRRPRRVEVRALERQDRLADDLYSMVQSPVDAALQLLSHLDTSPSESAVGGAWSAIESLLTAPGDDANVVAADRLAALVACAWPRAELTTLAARRMEAVEDRFTAKLRAAATNQERADLIASQIRAEVFLGLDAPADQAAVRRVQKLFKTTGPVLRDIEQYATEALRRLYRQRNLVLHGGRTDAIALRATLRTVAPLVGAGMDRIVHAHLEAGVDPLALAARARLELQRAGSLDAPPLTALLQT